MENENIRKTAVAGSFYPKKRDELQHMLDDCFEPYQSGHGSKEIAALIVPHAGYVFSGEVAAAAYAQLSPDAKYEHIFLIGPSHSVPIDGASINYAVDAYETPLGNVQVDKELCKELIDDNVCFVYHPSGDIKEHSLEVQLPFLQYRLKHLPAIVPIVIGSDSMHILKDMALALQPYFNEKNLFVISSDFSHYTDYNAATEADIRTGKAIETGDPKKFIEAIIINRDKKMKDLVTSACGQSAILMLLFLLHSDPHVHIKHLLYKNSGDSDYGSKDQVVGYHAFAFKRDKQNLRKSSAEMFQLSIKEKKLLLSIARQTIQNKLLGTHDVVYDKDEMTDILKAECGAFVTLHEEGRLRGCIGHLIGNMPLYKTIEQMALLAAFDDPRFKPLRKEELPIVSIEISVLSPLRRIYSIDEFKLGRDGIFMEKNGRSGTFLPQVAIDTNWSKEEFLGHCARDKAGLGWDGWQNANLYTYEAVVFSEDDVK